MEEGAITMNDYTKFTYTLKRFKRPPSLYF